MISLISGLYDWIFTQREEKEKEIRLLLVGLDGSGKTTFLECVKSSFRAAHADKRKKKKEISLQSSSPRPSLSPSTVAASPSSFSLHSRTQEEEEEKSECLSPLDEKKKKRRSRSSSSSFQGSPVKTSLPLHEDSICQTPDDEDLHASSSFSSCSPPPSSVASSHSSSSSLPSHVSLSSSSPPPPPSSSSSLPCVHPTTGFNLARVKIESEERIVLWDVGGRQTLQRIWREYINDADSILFFVDTLDRERLGEARQVFLNFCEEVQEETLQRFYRLKGSNNHSSRLFSSSRNLGDISTRDEGDESEERNGEHNYIEEEEEEEEEKWEVDGEGEIHQEGRGRVLAEEEQDEDEETFLLRHLLSTSVPPIFLVANKQDWKKRRRRRTTRGSFDENDKKRRRTPREEGRGGVSPGELLSFFCEGGKQHKEAYAEMKMKRSIRGIEDSGDQARYDGRGEEKREEEEEILDMRGVMMKKERSGKGVKNGGGDEGRETAECRNDGGSCRIIHAERREVENDRISSRRNRDEEKGEKKKRSEERQDSTVPVENQHRDRGEEVKEEEEVWLHGRKRNEEKEKEEDTRFDVEEEAKFDEKERFLGRGVARGVPFWCMGSSAYDESSVRTLLRCAVETAKLVKQLRKERKEEEEDQEEEEERQARLAQSTRRRLSSGRSSGKSNHFSSSVHERALKPNALSTSSSMKGLGAGEGGEEEEREKDRMSSERSLDRMMKARRDPCTAEGFDRLSSSSSASSTTCDSSASSVSSSSASSSSLSPSISTHPSSRGRSSSSSPSPCSSSSSFPFVTNRFASHCSSSSSSSPSSIPLKSFSRKEEQTPEKERKRKDSRANLQSSPSSSSSRTSDKSEGDAELFSPRNAHLTRRKQKEEKDLFFSSAFETERKIAVVHTTKKDGEEQEQGDRLIYGEGVVVKKKKKKVERAGAREEENSDRSFACEHSHLSLFPSERTSSSSFLPSPRRDLLSPGERATEGKVSTAEEILGEGRIKQEEKKNKKRESERKNEEDSEGLYDIEEALDSLEDFFASRLSLTTHRNSAIPSYPTLSSYSSS